ncbi:MAG TPA: endo-1,4-beta-xylanase [Pricia sp.]|nr:endo-1,4-beta-xylanase [Pricia sp.]
MKTSNERPKKHHNFWSRQTIKFNFMKMSRVLILALFALTMSCSSNSDDGPTVGGPTDGDGSTGGEDDTTDDDVVETVFLKDVADFPIGNIVSASKLASSSSDNMKFRSVLSDDYNSITAENDMKMANMFTGPDTYDFSDGDAIVAYAKENGLRVHGHALVWHASIPEWLNSFNGTDEEFEAQIEGYVKATVVHFAKEIDDNGNPIVTGWDVMNEYFDGGDIRQSLFRERMGDGYIEKLFTWAREADPDVKLFYNDYNIAGTPEKRNAIISMVNTFQANNIPIDGIGMQMHMNHEWPTSDLPLAIEEISATGLLVHGSELDVKVNSNNDITSFTNERALAQKRQFQRASYYYTTIVPEAQQYGMTIWGFRDQDSWLYDGGTDWPLLYDNDFNTKMAYDGFMAGLEEQNPE